MQKLSDGLVETGAFVVAGERTTFTAVEAFSQAILSAGFGQAIFVLADSTQDGSRSVFTTFHLKNSNSAVQVSVKQDLFRHYGTDYYQVLERMIVLLGNDYCFAEPVELLRQNTRALQILEPGRHSLTRIGTVFVSLSGHVPTFNTGYSALQFFLDSVVSARSTLTLSVATEMNGGVARCYLEDSAGCNYAIQLIKKREGLEMKIIQNSAASKTAEGTFPIKVQLGSIELDREDLLGLQAGTRIVLHSAMPLRGYFVINGEHRLAEVRIDFEDGQPSVVVERLTFADNA